MILCTTVANPSRQIFYSSKETTENYGTHKETTVPINPNIALDATNLFFFFNVEDIFGIHPSTLRGIYR